MKQLHGLLAGLLLALALPVVATETRLAALPHDALLTAYTRAHGRESLYVRDFTYTHGFIQDFGRYSLEHGWSGNIEQQSVLVCPIRRVGDRMEVRFIHDTRLEGGCPLRGNY